MARKVDGGSLPIRHGRRGLVRSHVVRTNPVDGIAVPSTSHQRQVLQVAIPSASGWAGLARLLDTGDTGKLHRDAARVADARLDPGRSIRKTWILLQGTRSLPVWAMPMIRGVPLLQLGTGVKLWFWLAFQGRAAGHARVVGVVEPFLAAGIAAVGRGCRTWVVPYSETRGRNNETACDSPSGTVPCLLKPKTIGAVLPMRHIKSLRPCLCHSGVATGHAMPQIRPLSHRGPEQGLRHRRDQGSRAGRAWTSSFTPVNCPCCSGPLGLGQVDASETYLWRARIMPVPAGSGSAIIELTEARGIDSLTRAVPARPCRLRLPSFLQPRPVGCLARRANVQACHRMWAPDPHAPPNGGAGARWGHCSNRLGPFSQAEMSGGRASKTRGPWATGHQPSGARRCCSLTRRKTHREARLGTARRAIAVWRC